MRIVALIGLMMVTSIAKAEAGPMRRASAQEEQCLESVCFAPSYSLESNALRLHGLALFEHWTFDVYVAALYLPSLANEASEVLGDLAKVLVLDYRRPISKADFIESTEAMLKKNPKVRLENIRSQLEKLYAVYEDVQAGDRYTIVYQPEVGTTLLLNGRAKATFPGSEIQRALFGIWLSEYSVSRSFTKALLRQAARQEEQNTAMTKR